MTNGIAVYKDKIRRYIPEFVPFYPLGMADLTVPSRPAALGMRAAGKMFIAVWRRNADEEIRLAGDFKNLRLLYPVDLDVQVRTGPDATVVTLAKPHMGCILAS